jgi:hypothetical protein
MTHFSHDSVKPANTGNLLAVSVNACRVSETLLEVFDRFVTGNRADSAR